MKMFFAIVLDFPMIFLWEWRTMAPCSTPTPAKWEYVVAVRVGAGLSHVT